MFTLDHEEKAARTGLVAAASKLNVLRYLMLMQDGVHLDETRVMKSKGRG